MAQPLRNPDFRVLFAGRVVDALGDAVSPVALTLAVVTATRSSVALAVILVCGMLPRVALLPFGGVVIDRAGARRVALVSDAVSGLTQLAIGLLLLEGHLDIAPIAIAAAAAGRPPRSACPLRCLWSRGPSTPTSGWPLTHCLAWRAARPAWRARRSRAR